MLLEELAAQREEGSANRLAIEEPLEEPRCPLGREPAGRTALGPDDAARTLAHEVRHEAIVEQRRQLGGLARIDEDERVAAQLDVGRSARVELAERDAAIADDERGRIRAAPRAQRRRLGMTIEVEDLVRRRVVRQRGQEFLTLRSRRHAESGALALRLGPEGFL